MDGIAATPRLHPQAAAAATAKTAAPVVLVDLDFASGPFRAWTGLGPLHWAGHCSLIAGLRSTALRSERQASRPGVTVLSAVGAAAAA